MPVTKSQQKLKKGGSPNGRSRLPIQPSFERDNLPPAHQAARFLQRTIGNRATAALIQRQEYEGSATVAGSTSADEGAVDEESYTQELAGEQTATDSSNEDLGEALEEKAVTATRFKSQHPSLAQLGIRPKEIKGKKVAAYIGNSAYQHTENWDSLPGAKADTEKMKGAMEGHQYKTLSHSEDKTAPEMDAIFRGALAIAGAGDALLLYYAGHGLPQGIAGVESKESDSLTLEPQGEGAEGTRGFKKPADVTDIESYSAIIGHLEGGVARGVHTTLISDACHSGAASDLVRVKAEEKLGESENDKVGAISEQIKRLEDLKAQMPEGTEGEAEAAAKVYWQESIRPELKAVEAYLKEAGQEIQIPHIPNDYSRGALEQPINLVINALIDLGEVVKQESEESTLSKAI